MLLFLHDPKGLKTCLSHSPVISPGVGLWALAVSTGLNLLSSPPLHPSSAPLLSSILAPLLSSCPAVHPPFLTPEFRPSHVLHNLPIPPLIASHSSGLFMSVLSFKTVSNQVCVPCSSCWCPPRPLYNPEIAASIPEHLTMWLQLSGCGWLWCIPNTPGSFVVVLGCNQPSIDAASF